MPSEREIGQAARAMVPVFCANGLHVNTPEEGAMDDVERERWNAVVEAATAALTAAERVRAEYRVFVCGIPSTQPGACAFDDGDLTKCILAREAETFGIKKTDCKHYRQYDPADYVKKEV